MSVERPASVYVTVRDPAAGKSKSLTVYGTTGESVFATVERALTVSITDAHPAPAGPVQDIRTDPVANVR